jgi:hypothetical protein
MNDGFVSAGDSVSPAGVLAGGLDRSNLKGIAVLGSHPATVDSAPFADDGWLIYVCSPHNIEHRTLPRWDQWFEVHIPVAHPTRSWQYLRGLEDQVNEKVARGDKPIVWMRDKETIPYFPCARLYPDASMRGTKKIHKTGAVDYAPGKFHRSQFKSSIAFMLAKAIKDCETYNIPQIGLWGILQASKSEFENQRPSTQYFLETAAERGIKVYVSAESQLFHDDAELF